MEQLNRAVSREANVFFGEINRVSSAEIKGQKVGLLNFGERYRDKEE